MGRKLKRKKRACAMCKYYKRGGGDKKTDKLRKEFGQKKNMTLSEVEKHVTKSEEL